jgi:hypothetical protein
MMTRTIGEISGAGCVTHIWCAFANEGFVSEKNSLRKVVLRMYWDGKAYNSWFPMPFASHARFEITSECDTLLNLLLPHRLRILWRAP